jgi:hydroxymethylbilane synthase
VIGTRGSDLARTQSGWVGDRLREAHPGLEVELRIIRTTGDEKAKAHIATLGGKGAWTREIQAELRAGTIDLAVHSLKDLPVVPEAGLRVVAYPEREDPRDAWIGHGGRPYASLSPGDRVGTSSLRRQAQLLARYPGVEVVPVRGNVPTRLAKAENGELDGVLLAASGMKRLGLHDRWTETLDPEVMLPSPGQGILAVEGRDDEETRALGAPIDHAPTRVQVEAERGFLRLLEGSCLVPAGAFARLAGEEVHLDAVVFSPDGTREVRVRGSAAADPDAARDLGERLGRELLEAGGREILRELEEGSA